MLRRLIGAVLVLGLGVLFWMNYATSGQITLSQAQIVTMADGSRMIMANIENDGPADVLQSFDIEGARHAHFMGNSKQIVIPAGSSPSLSHDGAHLMLQGGREIATGQLFPVTLSFEKSGDVVVRAKAVDMMMDHSIAAGVEAQTNVSLNLSSVSREGVIGTISVSGLEFVSVVDAAPHVAGQGHAHLYLNGLKLGRLFNNNFEIGGLLPGTYDLRVSLNANDHRPYIRDGAAVAAELSFTVE